MARLILICVLVSANVGVILSASEVVSNAEDLSTQNSIHKGTPKSRTLFDYQTRAVAYKDLIESRCLIGFLKGGESFVVQFSERARLNNRTKNFFMEASQLSKRKIYTIGGQRIEEFCRGFPTYLVHELETNEEENNIITDILPSDTMKRTKRSTSHFFVGRVRGQTQSQYLNFGNSQEPGKAEAESTYGSSKAVVSGSSGMGQAQSQSVPVGCDECYGQDQTIQYGRPGLRPEGFPAEKLRRPGYPSEERPGVPTFPGQMPGGPTGPIGPRQPGYPGEPGVTSEERPTEPQGPARPGVPPTHPGYPEPIQYPGHKPTGPPVVPGYPDHRIPGLPTPAPAGYPRYPGGSIPGFPSAAPEYPGTPGKPSEPRGTEQPSYPGPPAYPIPPGYPTRPGYPTQPGFPTRPGGPAQPEYPATPGVPLQPGYPAQPVPGYPVQPGVRIPPGYPTQPSGPIKPGYPEPGVPTQPGYPAGPGVPIQPGYPAGPAGPTQPGYPTLPGEPGYPAPTSPGYPTLPGYPAQPGYPTYPGYPTQPYPGYPRPAVPPSWPGKKPSEPSGPGVGERLTSGGGKFSGKLSGDYQQHTGQAGRFSGTFSGEYEAYQNGKLHGETGYPPGVEQVKYPIGPDGRPVIPTGAQPRYPQGPPGGPAGTRPGLPAGPPTYPGAPSTGVQTTYPGAPSIGVQPTYPGVSIGAPSLPVPGEQIRYPIPGQQPGYPSVSQPRYPGGEFPARPGYPGAVSALPGYPGGAPGYPGGVPGYPQIPSGAPGVAPAYPGGPPTVSGPAPGFPGGTPGYPSLTPGYPTGVAGITGGVPVFPEVVHGVPGGIPGVPAGTPGVPGGATTYPGGIPGYPGGAAGGPGVVSGYPEGVPGAPRWAPGYPGRVTGVPGVPGYPIGAPGVPAAPGYPSAAPGAPGGIPGYPGGVPGYAPGIPGYPGGVAGYPGAAIPGEAYTRYTEGQVDDSDSQVQTSVQQTNNETQASASAQGKFAGGTAQSQVSGTYSGSGSFSASAGSDDGKRGALSQVSGGKEGAQSSAQGRGGLGQSQAQVQLASDTGDTVSSAQTGGWNHGSQTQVQASSKGGMADAQANAPGSTSSQAQIGFTPYDENEADNQTTPFRGGGMASAQSGSYSGQAQSQIQGKFRYGIRYTGAAQAGSGSKDTVAQARNQTRPFGLSGTFPQFKPLNFTSGNSHTYNTQSQVVQTHNRKSSKKTVMANPGPPVRDIDETTPDDLDMEETATEEYTDDDYEDYENDFTTQSPRTKSIISQATKTQKQHIVLDPLEDLDATVQQSYGSYPLDGTVLQPGQFIPGSPGYQIPAGFRGRVKSIANGKNTYAAGRNSQAQSVTLMPGTGKIIYKKPIYAVSSNTHFRNGHIGFGSGYTYQPVTYQLKSGRSLPNFVSLSKSETGSKNPYTGQKTPSVYYTQSSSCGVFTNTCVFNNSGKLCFPKPKTNPDGSFVSC